MGLGPSGPYNNRVPIMCLGGTPDKIMSTSVHARAGAWLLYQYRFWGSLMQLIVNFATSWDGFPSIDLSTSDQQKICRHRNWRSSRMADFYLPKHFKSSKATDWRKRTIESISKWACWRIRSSFTEYSTEAVRRRKAWWCLAWTLHN